jgi:hypothetical protein
MVSPIVPIGFIVLLAVMVGYVRMVDVYDEAHGRTPDDGSDFSSPADVLAWWWRRLFH